VVATPSANDSRIRNRVARSTSVPIAERFPGSHDQITLPVTGLHAVLDLDWPLVDHSHRSQPSAPSQPRQTPPAATTPRGPRQLDRWVVDRFADRLLAQPAQRLIDKQLVQFVRDLLRAPALRQQPADGLGQHAIDGNAPLAGPARPELGGVLCMVRANRPSGSLLRRISRLIVDGARPSSRAIPRTVSPDESRSAIRILSSSERYRGLRGLASMAFTGR
jgi:hypothetical protein